MKIYKIIKALPLLLIFAFISACGPSDTVKLTYPQKDASILPSPSAASVAVVLFTDKRQHTHIGNRKNGTTFASNVAVPEWVSRSVAEALNNHGFQVSYAESVDVANKANPKYIVTGTLNQAELKEVSIAELRATMQVDINLSSYGKSILTEGLSASQSETGIITASTAETLLRETVQELIKPGVNRISQTINKK